MHVCCEANANIKFFISEILCWPETRAQMFILATQHYTGKIKNNKVDILILWYLLVVLVKLM